MSPDVPFPYPAQSSSREASTYAWMLRMATITVATISAAARAVMCQSSFSR
jgi:hypothetical protein